MISRMGEYVYNEESMKTIIMIMAKRLRFSTLPITFSTLSNYMNKMDNSTNALLVVNESLEMEYKSRYSLFKSDVEVFNDVNNKRDVTIKVNFNDITHNNKNVVILADILNQITLFKIILHNGGIIDIRSTIDLSSEIHKELQLKREKYNTIYKENEYYTSIYDDILTCSILYLECELLLSKYNIDLTRISIYTPYHKLINNDKIKNQLITILNNLERETVLIESIRTKENDYLLSKLQYRNSMINIFILI